MKLTQNQQTWREKIPAKYYNGNGPKARTIGTLIKLLQQLPPTLPIRSAFNRSVQVTVYNINKPNRHATIQEPE